MKRSIQLFYVFFISSLFFMVQAQEGSLFVRNAEFEEDSDVVQDEREFIKEARAYEKLTEKYGSTGAPGDLLYAIESAVQAVERYKQVLAKKDITEEIRREAEHKITALTENLEKWKVPLEEKLAAKHKELVDKFKVKVPAGFGNLDIEGVNKLSKKDLDKIVSLQDEAALFTVRRDLNELKYAYQQLRNHQWDFSTHLGVADNQKKEKDTYYKNKVNELFEKNKDLKMLDMVQQRAFESRMQNEYKQALEPGLLADGFSRPDSELTFSKLDEELAGKGLFEAATNYKMYANYHSDLAARNIEKKKNLEFAIKATGKAIEKYDALDDKFSTNIYHNDIKGLKALVTKWKGEKEKKV